MQLMSQDADWCWLNVQMFKCSNVQMLISSNLQMSNVNKVQLVSERTSGVSTATFKHCVGQPRRQALLRLLGCHDTHRHHWSLVPPWWDHVGAGHRRQDHRRGHLLQAGRRDLLAVQPLGQMVRWAKLGQCWVQQMAEDSVHNILLNPRGQRSNFYKYND